MSQIKIQVQKERCNPLEAYPEDLQKSHSQLTVYALTLTTHTTGNARRNKLPPRPFDNELLRQRPEQQELQQVEAKLLYKAVKRETPTIEYYKAAETEKRLDHNPSGQTRLPQNQRTTPRHTPTETTELTEHQSDQVRPESHDTSSNIPDLHKVGKEQPGITTRDTEQPREKQRLTIGTTTSDLHKVQGPQAEPPCTLDT
ncbi:hypothetical protein Taro_007503 [Colocasia esculenta]|uniref:Uncharacterized protein n=1 Tax=Colocasia esculenta TaxID=4460 RepID=A0A843U0K3_COLES|nr:hypothetical protein [Colocasia esculenta]